MAYQKVLNISLDDDDLDGTSPLEVFSVTLFVPICSIILSLAVNVFQWPSRTVQLLEICILNLSLLLALTLFSENLILYLMILFLTALVVLLKGIPCFSFKQGDLASIPVKDLNMVYVCGYRGHLLLATCTCILAVDFGFFSSRFAKTETFGWSVMDAGVGSFVLLHGLTSAHGKGFASKGLQKCFSSSVPLLVLGFVRLAAISAVGYHKVVPEYGIHWNFFFTLAFTKLVCCSILELTPRAGFLAVSSALAHQLLLSRAGVTQLVLSESRATFFEANKEGICSLPGFISLYFCGVWLGRIVWRKGSQTSEYFSLLLQLCTVGVVGWVLMHALHSSVQPVSRRMANLSYCVWVVSLTSLQLALHLLQELVLVVLGKVLDLKKCDFKLWRAINYNGLAYFLLANLLTGLVNITMDTGKASDINSLLIMVLYLTFLTYFSVACYEKSFQLKMC